MFRYAIKPAPLLSRSNFQNIYSLPLELDSEGLFRPLEMIALPGTKLLVIEEGKICSVQLEGYPVTPLYVDRRFLGDSCKKQKPRLDPSAIVEELMSMEGLPYVWGGNYRRGIPEMIDYYPPARKLSAKERVVWTSAGVDCSGMLYEATNGYTPRNTAEMFHFGKTIPLEEGVHPLDLLLWKGHVSIVLSRNETIESRAKRGCVFKTPLDQRLEEIKEETQGKFIVKRWI